MDNPFTPSFGAVPYAFAGRKSLINSLEHVFAADLETMDPLTLLAGSRGTGKTALLARMRIAAERFGWISVPVKALPGMLDTIEEQAVAAAGRLGIECREGFAAPVRGRHKRQSEEAGNRPLHASRETDDPRPDAWRVRMGQLLDRLEPAGIGLLVTVDDAQGGFDDMDRLLAAYQSFALEGRKAALALAGLPSRMEQLAAGSSSQLLRNSRLYELGRIDEQDSAEALMQTFEHGGKTIERAALEQCAGAVEGSPYMLQLVGSRTWAACRKGDIVTEEDAREGIRLARKEFEQRILDAAFRELSKGDLRFLIAMLDDRRESRLADISRRMGVKSNYATKYKSRLLSQGVVEELGNNVFRFAIPGFRQYLAMRLEEMEALG